MAAAAPVAWQHALTQAQQNVSTSVRQAGTDVQSLGQPGGCRTYINRILKKFQRKSFRPLPSGFPVNASLGSVDELQWFQKKSYQEWYRIPDYIRWMIQYTADFQNDVEYRTKTQLVVRAFLDAILMLTSQAASPMGLSNFSSDPNVRGVVVDHNGNKLMKPDGSGPAKITFVGTNGTFFLVPFIGTVPMTTNEVVRFPVLILPKTSDNDGGAGNRFLYFVYEFPMSLFANNPTPTPSTYTLRVQEYQNLVPLIREFQADPSISSSDKDRISQGIMSMLGGAIAGTTVSAYEQGYQEIVFNWLSSKLLTPEEFPAGATEANFSTPGNEPMDLVFSMPNPAANIPQQVQGVLLFDLTQIAGSSPSYEFTAAPEVNGYGLQIKGQKVYFGYDPQYTSASTVPAATPLGWYTASSLTQDLALVPLAPVVGSQMAKPTVFSSITDNVLFTVDESGPTALLKVLDRTITLTQTDTSTPTSYHLFLKRQLQSAFISKNIPYDSSKGLQGNITLSNMAVFSGMNIPMIQALSLNMLRGVCKDSIPIAPVGVTSGPSYGPFTPYSTVFNSATREVIYRTSIEDIMRYFVNQQSQTWNLSVSGGSITLAENQAIKILNPTGAYKATGNPSVSTTDVEAVAPKEPGATDSFVETFSSGINFTCGVSEGSDLVIRLNSINVTAGAGLSGSDAKPAVVAKANFQNGSYAGQQLTSTGYTVSRLATGAGRANGNTANANANANARDPANKAPANSMANKVAVRNVIRANANANADANANAKSNRL
jgi:hypothetical protein